MIVLGIDPGTARTGYGVIRVEGGRVSALAHGVITTGAREDPGQRLSTIFECVRALVAMHEPHAVALESLFVGANPQTVLGVGQARGAVLAACGAAGVPSAEYAPSQVKQAVCGYGRADKGQVGFMVSRVLAMSEEPGTDHAADALAVAVCHAFSGTLQVRSA